MSVRALFFANYISGTEANEKQESGEAETDKSWCPVPEISIRFVAIKMGRRQGGPSRTGGNEGAYLDRYVTDEKRSRRPIFIATLRAARLLAGCFVAHRSKTTAGILPLRFAHPAKIRGGAAIPVTDLVH